MRSSSLFHAAALAYLIPLTIGGPARAASLSTTTVKDGALLINDGDRTLARITPKTALAARGKPTARELSVAGHALIEVRIPVERGPAGRSEIWIAERTKGAPSPIWWDIAGPLDEDGETARVVQASDHGIEDYQTARRLSRCDGAEVPLFRRRWDFARQAFRPVGPDLPPRSATTVAAHRGGAPAGKPLGGFFFSAASSSAGATEQAARIRPPTAVNDDRPETAWTTAGDGRGQLLTARSSGGFAITGLRLLPGDASSEGRFRASAKPKRLTLVFGRDAASNVDVDLIEDADGGGKRYREPFWIALPKPVTSACVTVVVRETTSDKSPMSLADLDVMTELDGPEAADRLVTSLAQGDSCTAHTPLVVRLGQAALGKLENALAHAAPGAGRQCLVAALAALVSAGTPLDHDAGAGLVAALVHATPDEEAHIAKLLPTLGEAPVPALGLLLTSEARADDDRLRAARLLRAIDTEAARTHLLAAVGRGSRDLRKGLRETVDALPPTALPAALAELAATPPADIARRADFLAIVGTLAAKDGTAAAAAVAALRAPLENGAAFEEQARALQGLGLLKDKGALALLVAVRDKSDDGVLRSLAVEEIANSDAALAIPALRAALADKDPLVRATAAAGLGRRRAKEAAAEMVTGAKQEPWPQVRRAEVVALGQLCTEEGNALLLRAFQRDTEDVRQAALTSIAHCYGAKATGTLLRTLGRQAESADMRSLAVRLLAERKEPRIVPALAEVMRRLLTESQADVSVEAVIADTAMTLATIRDAAAVATIASLLSDPRASIQCMGIDALALICDPGAGAAALRAAAQAKDASVASRAAAALAHCREPRSND